MHKCDFCAKDHSCSGVQRSECLVRDHLYFEMEQTPADNEKTITRLLLAAGGVAEPCRVAQYLIRNGVGIVR